MWPSLHHKKLEVRVESNLTFNTRHMQRTADIVNRSECVLMRASKYDIISQRLSQRKGGQLLLKRKRIVQVNTV